MKILIGDTGLIGTTLKEYLNFDFLFNTKNISEFIDKVPDYQELYLSCLPATKWLVNKNLKKDIENIYNILNILKTKKYSKVFLFSTIDVYNDSPLNVDESYAPNLSKLSYGNNRYLFELLVKEFIDTENLKIFRLPALFNKNIKKNIIYDFIHNNNVNLINLNSKYQWYNLDNLNTDINNLINQFPREKVFNLFTEPIETSEMLNFFPQYKNTMLLYDKKIEYNFKTKFTSTGYIKNKQQTLLEIKKFVDEVSIK
jgi:hypothetical protein